MSKKRIRARKMWVYTYAHDGTPAEPWEISSMPSKHGRNEKSDMPCYVLPATAEAYEQMVEQMAKSIFESIENTVQWMPLFPCGMWRRRYTDAARAALRAIGITPPKKGRT